MSDPKVSFTVLYRNESNICLQGHITNWHSSECQAQDFQEGHGLELWTGHVLHVKPSTSDLEKWSVICKEQITAAAPINVFSCHHDITEVLLGLRLRQLVEHCLSTTAFSRLMAIVARSQKWSLFKGSLIYTQVFSTKDGIYILCTNVLSVLCKSCYHYTQNARSPEYILNSKIWERNTVGKALNSTKKILCTLCVHYSSNTFLL